MGKESEKKEEKACAVRRVEKEAEEEVEDEGSGAEYADE